VVSSASSSVPSALVVVGSAEVAFLARPRGAGASLLDRGRLAAGAARWAARSLWDRVAFAAGRVLVAAAFAGLAAAVRVFAAGLSAVGALAAALVARFGGVGGGGAVLGCG